MKLALLLLCLCTLKVAIEGVTYYAWVCEGYSLTSVCGFGTYLVITGAFYGRGSASICDPANNPNVNCSSPQVAARLATRCQFSPDCLWDASSNRFTDTCPNVNKYLIVAYECRVGNPIHYACENDVLTVRCPSPKRIRVISATYGRHTNLVCNANILGITSVSNTNCHLSTSFSTVNATCYNQRTCRFVVNDNTLGGDPCVGTYKYLYVNHTCV
nr:skin mucus lectin [Crepidula fornicata]